MSKKLKISLLLIISFIILTLLIVFDKTTGFDNFIYHLITSHMNDPLTKVNKCFTFLGSTLFIIILSVFFFFFYLFKKRKNCSFIIASIIIISTVLNNVIKLIIRRERPLVLALVTEKSFSFPSGHTMASTTLYGILLYFVIKSNLNKKVKIFLSIILVLIPLLVGVSRIYLGAHYASDVLGGFILSVSLILVSCHYIAKKELL